MQTENEKSVRDSFEAMHNGRDLTRHHLRGTYVKPQIAALWNQHCRTWQAALQSQSNTPQDGWKPEMEVSNAMRSAFARVFDVRKQKETFAPAVRAMLEVANAPVHEKGCLWEGEPNYGEGNCSCELPTPPQQQEQSGEAVKAFGYAVADAINEEHALGGGYLSSAQMHAIVEKVWEEEK